MLKRSKLLTTAMAVVSATLISACSDGSDNQNEPDAQYDFTSVDTALQEFLDGSEVFDGISVTLVDVDQGMVHEAAFGDHTVDTIVQLASTSKVPSVTLLMALDADDRLNYDVESTIDTYLPWDGVYGDRTSVHLVSNTAGIPGLTGIGIYGDHLCQFSGVVTLEACAETLYTVELAGSVAPGTQFSYGGTQWQLAGAVVEQVSNSTFNQAFAQYIGEPCELDVFTYGNMWSNLDDWNGSPDSLTGQQNAHVEGGAITSLQDYAKILLLHLREGRCGDQQVLPPEAVEFMQVNRAGELGVDYGMGWWINPGDETNSTIIYDPGAFGAISWLDMDRGIGGYVAIDDYTRRDPGSVYAMVLAEVIPAQQAAVDAARAAVAN
jgi:CubicO group peptidase (beta-lactamase class C family)